jgi:hypothetical protein
MNIIQLETTTHSYTGTSSGAGINSIDDNFDTYQGIIGPLYGGGGGSSTATCISQHIFTVAKKIVQVTYRIYARTWNSFNGNGVIYTRLEYTNNGTDWSTLSGTESNYGPFYSSARDYSIDTGTVTLNVSLTGCLGIRAYSYAWSNAGDAWGQTWAYIYEVQAFSYTDINLKYYDGDTIRNIGVETLNTTHKLRVRKGAVTYGIPLIATGDTDACNLRIRDGGTTKSVPIIT